MTRKPSVGAVALERFPVVTNRNGGRAARAGGGQWRAVPFRHPGAACERSEQAGTGRDPCTRQLALGTDNTCDRAARHQNERKSWLAGAWVPAFPRSGLSGPRGAGMTLVVVESGVRTTALRLRRPVTARRTRSTPSRKCSLARLLFRQRHARAGPSLSFPPRPRRVPASALPCSARRLLPPSAARGGPCGASSRCGERRCGTVPYAATATPDMRGRAYRLSAARVLADMGSISPTRRRLTTLRHIVKRKMMFVLKIRRAIPARDRAVPAGKLRMSGGHHSSAGRCCVTALRA
jgi:hypothetical protein